jgi:hypothetical protein
MSKNINWFIILAASFFVAGSAFLFSFIERKETDLQQEQASEHIQLALRRTAHLLLRQAGDSTSTIAPVKQTAGNKYVVELKHAFNYDSLPKYLQSSFDAYRITDKYDVAVWDCSYDNLVLGYSSFDILKKGNLESITASNLSGSEEAGVPCAGRGQNEACLNFAVTFMNPSLRESFWTVKSENSTYLLFTLGGLLALILAFILYFKANYTKNKINTNLKEEIALPKEITDINLIFIGKTQFDTKNHTLLIDNIEQKLTYQEAQLLQLFCKNKNELLERDFILKTVWDDDGALITRSVDVFVSRLRKLLKPDASLKIATVHGRGYRFEI